MEEFQQIINNWTYTEKPNIPSYTPHKSRITELLNYRENLYKKIRTQSDVIFEYKNEIVRPNNNKFFVFKCSEPEKIDMFLTYIQFYLINSFYHTHHLSIGIDLEFNRDDMNPSHRKIALMQLSFYPLRKYKYIFIIEPTNKYFTDKQLDIIIKSVYTSPINKITHGSDSLDIPYIFEDLLKKDKKKLMDYINHIYDTRFMCEYYKIKTKHENRKCSIYDALLFFNVISNEKYQELDKNFFNMGPIQDINWNVANMDSFRTKYSACDVLFLKELIINILSKHVEGISDLIECGRYIIFEKYEILNLYNTIKPKLDSMNIYFVKNTTNSMIKLFTEFINKHNDDYPILQINFFKTDVKYLFKFIFYHLLLNTFKIQQTKKLPYDKKLKINEIYEPLHTFGFNKMIDMLNKFTDDARIFLNK